MEMTASVRVRFAETDALGVVWHGNFFQYFEMGRVEWLRAAGLIEDLQAQKLRLTLVHSSVDFHLPAQFDDLLSVRTRLIGNSKVRLSFRHEIARDSDVLATATVELVCLNANGRVCRIPENFFELQILQKSEDIPHDITLFGT